jgi:hypothetical protein
VEAGAFSTQARNSKCRNDSGRLRPQLSAAVAAPAPDSSASASAVAWCARRPFFSGVHRFGVQRFALFLQDPFHTLLK